VDRCAVRNKSYDCCQNEWKWCGIMFGNICCKGRFEKTVVA